MKTKQVSLPIENQLFGIEKAMELLEIKSRPTIYNLMDKKKLLPYRQQGGRRMFTIEDILTYQNRIRVNY